MNIQQETNHLQGFTQLESQQSLQQFNDPQLYPQVSQQYPNLPQQQKFQQQQQQVVIANQPDNREEIQRYPKLWGRFEVWDGSIPWVGGSVQSVYQFILYFNGVLAFILLIQFGQQLKKDKDDKQDKQYIPAIFNLLTCIYLVFTNYLGCKSNKESTKRYLYHTIWLMRLMIFLGIITIISDASKNDYNDDDDSNDDYDHGQHHKDMQIFGAILIMILVFINWYLIVRVIFSYYQLKYFKLPNQNANQQMVVVLAQQQNQNQFGQNYQQDILQGIPIQHQQQLEMAKF